MEEVALAFESEKTCAHIREILEGREWPAACFVTPEQKSNEW